MNRRVPFSESSLFFTPILTPSLFLRPYSLCPYMSLFFCRAFRSMGWRCRVSFMAVCRSLSYGLFASHGHSTSKSHFSFSGGKSAILDCRLFLFLVYSLGLCPVSNSSLLAHARCCRALVHCPFFLEGKSVSLFSP